MKTTAIKFGDLSWQCLVAENAHERTKGLLQRASLPAGELMLIPRCNMIHTFGMRFPIDVIFLDSRGIVKRIVRNLPSNRIAWGGWAARQTLETQSGWLPEVPLGSSLALERGSRA